jgi:diketogulonate reductase-like aldo/keto reductase
MSVFFQKVAFLVLCLEGRKKGGNLMKYMTVKGEKLSQLGLGTWNMGENASRREEEIAAIRYGLFAGVNVIDTAEMYGEGQAESLVGEAIKDLDRSQLFLISKFYPWHASPDDQKKSLAASLKRLGTDYLDLYLLHWKSDYPLAETVKGLQDLEKAGLIRHWGVSNFDMADMQELVEIAGEGAVFANEDLYNLDKRGVEYDLLPWQKQHGIAFIGYSPFNSGDGQSIPVKASLKQIADERSVSVHQVLLAWTMRTGQVLTIPKASSIAHMRANLAAADLVLTAGELAALDRDYLPPKSKQPLESI